MRNRCDDENVIEVAFPCARSSRHSLCGRLILPPKLGRALGRGFIFAGEAAS